MLCAVCIDLNTMTFDNVSICLMLNEWNKFEVPKVVVSFHPMHSRNPNINFVTEIVN